MKDIIQGTDEWKAVRCGRVTASRVADVVAKTKTGFGASRGNYMAELIAERLTGETADSYTNAAMQWGTDMEPQARAEYEFAANVTVTEIGFVEHPSIAMTGASPDGLVGDDGMVEIKCPNTSTHIDTLLTGTVFGKYDTQMQWQMACAGRMWCDFVSFDPRLPASMQLFVRRVQRDDGRVAELEECVSVFLSELAEKVEALTEKYAPKIG